MTMTNETAAEIEQWKNSGRFIYCLVLTAQHQTDSHLQQKYPYALDFGLRKVLNVDKRYTDELIAQLGDDYDFEYSELSVKPMFLTHAQLVEVMPRQDGLV